MLRRFSERNLTHHARSAVGASATTAVKTLVLDLGSRHTFDRLLAVKRGVASTNETLIIEQAHDGDAQSPNWVACPSLAMTGLCASPASGADMVVAAVPTARWVRVKHTNGDTAQTALVLELTALPA
jgi:hypothetical protein